MLYKPRKYAHWTDEEWDRFSRSRQNEINRRTRARKRVVREDAKRERERQRCVTCLILPIVEGSLAVDDLLAGGERGGDQQTHQQGEDAVSGTYDVTVRRISDNDDGGRDDYDADDPRGNKAFYQVALGLYAPAFRLDTRDGWILRMNIDDLNRRKNDG